MKNIESSSNTRCIKSVKILDVEKRYKPGPKHYVYLIKVHWSNPDNVFIIYRRYTQFFDLQCKLLDLFAETPLESNGGASPCQVPYLPGKIILGRSQTRTIALKRQEGFDEYCQKLISLPERISRSRPILEFFYPSATDFDKSIQSNPDEKKSSTDHSIAISSSSKLATYQCVLDYNADEKSGVSLKKDDIVEVLDKYGKEGYWLIKHGDQTGFIAPSCLVPIEQDKSIHQTENQSIDITYVVNTSYEKANPDEISLEQGSFVIVMEKSLTGWWLVKFNDVVGQFPASYLTSCKGLNSPEYITSDASNLTTNIDDFDDSDWDDDDDDDDEEEVSRGLVDDSNCELCYVHTDFISHMEDSLSCKRGDLFKIYVKRPNRWCYGRINDGERLAWIPEDHLQKEPISNAIAMNEIVTDNTYEYDSNILDIVPNHLTDKQEDSQQTDLEKQQLDSNSISTETINAEEIEKPQVAQIEVVDNKPSPSITVLPTCNKQDSKPKLVLKQVVHNKPSTFMTSADDNENTKPKSVKDLIKKFDQLEV